MINKTYSRPLPMILVAGFAVQAISVAHADDWLEDPVSGCMIWTDEQDSFRETATWAGPCVDGKASGEGVLVWFKDDAILGRYEGSMQGGKLHGSGILYYRPPDRIGDLRADIGDRTLDNGRVFYHYEGSVTDGDLDGRGMLYYRSERGYDRYEGEFRNGDLDGQVVYEGAAGDRFEGEAQSLNGTGTGVYVSASGERYEGALVNGEPSGPGTYTAPNGDEFKANFVDGQAHGKVIVIRADGRREELHLDHGQQVK